MFLGVSFPPTCQESQTPGGPSDTDVQQNGEQKRDTCHRQVLSRILDKNSNNANNMTGKPPVDYEAVRKILKSLLRELGYSPEEPTREDLKTGGGATDKQVRYHPVL